MGGGNVSVPDLQAVLQRPHRVKRRISSAGGSMPELEPGAWFCLLISAVPGVLPGVPHMPGVVYGISH